MHLYQNEISIIKYFNYDDTSKTKDVRKYQNINAILESLRFKNYLELRMRECAPAYKTFRSHIPRKENYTLLKIWIKTTASQPVQISVWTPFSFSIVPKKHKFKKKTSTNFALLINAHYSATDFIPKYLYRSYETIQVTIRKTNFRKHFPILKFGEQKVTSID